jgi:Protein of unknown function (DUF3685)
VNWYTYGISQIDRELVRVGQILGRSQLSTLDRVFWEGRQRELRAARWLVRRLAGPIPPDMGERVLPDSQPEPLSLVAANNSEVVSIANLLNPRPLSGRNLTSIPLEIDILRPDRQQELLQIVWQQIRRTIEELQAYQVSQEQLLTKIPEILTTIWSSSTTIFIGQYYSIRVEEEYPVLPYLLQDRELIATEFLAKIPLVYETFAYLLFQYPIVVDNQLRDYGDRVASDRVRQLLDNLVIRLSNAVTQPLLNRFSDFEQVKQRFFEPRLISTREITKFRNLLSWHYHRYKYLIDPTNIFESRHSILTFTNLGIEAIAIYSPRRPELTTLKGLPLLVTLGLEFRDAIAPLVTSVTTFLGRIIVYILTDIIGRGIGLITRGVLQGVGNAWQGKM